MNDHIRLVRTDQKWGDWSLHDTSTEDAHGRNPVLVSGTSEWDASLDNGTGGWLRPSPRDYEMARAIRDGDPMARKAALAYVLAEWHANVALKMQITPKLGPEDAMMWRLVITTQEGWPIFDKDSPDLDALIAGAVREINDLGGPVAAIKAALSFFGESPASHNS